MVIAYYQWESEYWAVIFFLVSHMVKGIAEQVEGSKRAMSLILLVAFVHGWYGLWWVYMILVFGASWLGLNMLALVEWGDLWKEILEEAQKAEEEEKEKEDGQDEQTTTGDKKQRKGKSKTFVEVEIKVNMPDGSVKAETILGKDKIGEVMKRVGLGDGEYLTAHGTMSLLEPSKTVQEYDSVFLNSASDNKDGIKLDVLVLNKKTA